MALKISESAAVQMPMKTVASLIAMVAIGTWAYFGLHETLNSHSTQIELMQKDLEQNTEFRIKFSDNPFPGVLYRINNFIPGFFNTTSLHVFSPQFRRRTYQYLLFSIDLYFLRSTQMFALSNQAHYF